MTTEHSFFLKVECGPVLREDPGLLQTVDLVIQLDPFYLSVSLSLLPASLALWLRCLPRLQCDFSRLSHTSDLKIGTPVAILPGGWQHRVSTETGQPSVSTL